MPLVARRCGHVIVTAVVTVALMSGVAFAVGALPVEDGVVEACYKTKSGTLRVLTKSSPACKRGERPIDWNQQGLPGQDGRDGADGQAGAPGADGANGQSVVMADEPAGANCAVGGVKLTVGSDVRYVCNGLDGEDGAAGPRGAPGRNGFDPTVSIGNAPVGACATGGKGVTIADISGPHTFFVCNGAQGPAGASFDGSYSSPNGQYKLQITDSGIFLGGPGGGLDVGALTAGLSSPRQVTIEAGNPIGAPGNGALVLNPVHAVLRGLSVDVNGLFATRLGACVASNRKPVAFAGSFVTGEVAVFAPAGRFPFEPGSHVLSGSDTVSTCSGTRQG